jgi:hypothetical protein
VALAVGLTAYVGAMVVLAEVAGRRLLAARLGLLAVMAAVALGGARLEVDGAVVVGIVAVLGIGIAFAERGGAGVRIGEPA